MLLTYERFGSLTLPIYDPIEPIGAFDGRASFIDLPAGGAARGYGTGRAVRDTRTVRRTATLLGASLAEVDTAFALLIAACGTADRLYARRPDGGLVWTMAELSSVEASREPRAIFRGCPEVALDLDMEFTLFAPPWNGNEHGLGWTLDSGKVLDSGLVLDQAIGDVFSLVGGSTNTKIVTNGGNATVRRVTYTLTAPGGGSITPPSAGAASVNIATVPAESGHTSQLAYYGTIAVGKSLIIDGGAQGIYNNTAPDYQNLAFDVAHVISGWIELGPGDNSLQISYNGPNGATLLVEFAEAFA